MKKTIFSCLILLFSISTYSQLRFTDVTIPNNNENDGLVHINWTLSSQTEVWDYILIYRRIDDPEFSLRANVPYNNNNFVDDSLCGVDVVYKLYLYQGGVAVDSITKDPVYEDDARPESTLLYSLNYDNDSIALNWKKTEDLTATGYILMHRINNNFDILTYIEDPNKTSFKLGTEILPCERQDRLLMITTDLCLDIGSVFGFEYLQSLTLIENLSNDKCQRTVTINFSEYIPAEGLNQRILEHEIWASEGEEDSIRVDTVPAGTTQYVHKDINSGSEYKYTIKTFLEIDGDTTVSSFCCPDSILTKEIPLPDFFETEHVTVTDDNLIELKVRADTVSINGYAVYRNTVGEEPQLVAQLNPQAQETWTFTDSTANPEKESYFYDVIVIDECGIEALDADTTSRSIHLSVETENNTNFLEWNAYEGWPVDTYVVYRYAPGSDIGTELAALPAGFNTYEDLVNENPEEGQWRYRVLAVAMGSREESWSNFASANQETFFRMPNAFRPEGITSYQFKPKSTNLTSNNYQMLIYNRWGQLIFESESPQAGWDGKFEGSYVQSGSYIYYIKYEDNNGEQKTKKGTVLVIR